MFSPGDKSVIQTTDDSLPIGGGQLGIIQMEEGHSAEVSVASPCTSMALHRLQGAFEVQRNNKLLQQ